MKKVLGLVFVIIISFILNLISVDAAALRKNSIKTCPNGVKYGYYVSGGTNHWHVAQECDSFSGWCPNGEELSGDPCPGGSSSNRNTTKETTTKTTTTRVQTTSTTTTSPPLTSSSISETTTTTTKSTEVKETSSEPKQDESSDDETGIIGGIFTLGVLGAGAILVKNKIKK